MLMENLVDPQSSSLIQVNSGAAWSLVTMKMLLFVRQWQSSFTSQRVQSRGVDAKQLMQCLGALDQFRLELPKLMSWDHLTLVELDLGSLSPGDGSHQNLIKCLQLEMVQARFLISLAEAVELFGFEKSEDIWETSLVHFKLNHAVNAAHSR